MCTFFTLGISYVCPPRHMRAKQISCFWTLIPHLVILNGPKIESFYPHSPPTNPTTWPFPVKPNDNNSLFDVSPFGSPPVVAWSYFPSFVYLKWDNGTYILSPDIAPSFSTAPTITTLMRSYTPRPPQPIFLSLLFFREDTFLFLPHRPHSS